MTLSAERSSVLACSTVSRPRKRFGLTPAQRVNRRWAWNGLRPMASATSSSGGCSSRLAAMKRMALATRS